MGSVSCDCGFFCTSTSLTSSDGDEADTGTLPLSAPHNPLKTSTASLAARILLKAASGVPIDKVIAYEPPYVDDAGTNGGATHLGRLTQLITAGNRGGAIKYFMKDMVGAPGIMVSMMRFMPGVCRKLEAVAHTLPYDATLMTDFRIPRSRYASIRVPVLMMNGAKTQQRLRDAARIVAEVIPGARYQELAGQTHNVSPAALTPPVVEFLAS